LRKKKDEKENENIIKKYKKQLKKVLLELLKEENREKKLEKLDMNEFQRDILEIKFKEERAKNHLMITQKNL